MGGRKIEDRRLPAMVRRAPAAAVCLFAACPCAYALLSVRVRGPSHPDSCAAMPCLTDSMPRALGVQTIISVSVWLYDIILGFGISHNSFSSSR